MQNPQLRGKYPKNQITALKQHLILQDQITTLKQQRKWLFSEK